MSKKATPKDEKFENQDLDLFEVLAALDCKDYDYYSNLTEEQRSKFLPYLTTWWMSSIKDNKNSVMDMYYLVSTNDFANKHLFNEYVQRQPELQWKMLCVASAGDGKKFHNWIPRLSEAVTTLKREATKKEVSEYFTKIYKTAKPEDIEEIATAYTINQQRLYKIATMYPAMKRNDVEILSAIITDKELEEYERDSGNEV